MRRDPSLPFLAAGIARGRELAASLGRWWLRELLDLFPERVAAWLVDSGGRALVLAPAPDAVVLHLETDRGRQLASARIGRDAYAATRIDAFLRAHRLDRARVAIGLRLPDELIFCRSFAVPLAARRVLATVIVEDLLAKTPFQLNDIHHGHRVRRTGDRLLVSQSVVRRAHVTAEAEALGLEPDEIGFVEPSGSSVADVPPRIAMRQSPAGGQGRWVARMAFGLALSALLMVGTAFGARYHRQQEVLDALRSETAAAAAKVKHVLAANEMRAQERAVVLSVRARRDEPGMLDLWEEATRALPAHTWLSELRLSETPDGRQVVMTGLSGAAASLIGLLDRSALFTEASLVGPIAVDPTEGRERFVLQAKVKPAASAGTAAR